MYPTTQTEKYTTTAKIDALVHLGRAAERLERRQLPMARLPERAPMAGFGYPRQHSVKAFIPEGGVQRGGSELGGVDDEVQHHMMLGLQSASRQRVEMHETDVLIEHQLLYVCGDLTGTQGDLEVAGALGSRRQHFAGLAVPSVHIQIRHRLREQV